LSVPDTVAIAQKPSSDASPYSAKRASVTGSGCHPGNGAGDDQSDSGEEDEGTRSPSEDRARRLPAETLWEGSSLLTRAQARTLTETAHRPWPLPEAPWLMAQTWEDLLFAHWRVSSDALRRVVPLELPLDTFDGSAWIGVTPFLVRAMRLRLTPPVPLLARFPELNVRTYVTIGGRPGIYFLSLDAASWLAVFGARRAFRIPYFRAAMNSEHRAGGVSYASERVAGDGEAATFRGSYRPTGSPFAAKADSLEYFLTERYCLYTFDEHLTVYRAEIHHPPWPLQLAEADLEVNTMAEPFGIELQGKPLLHFAARQDVLIWPRRPVRTD
jgi:uncharacterized protein YqjF (DUF2071 family)